MSEYRRIVEFLAKVEFDKVDQDSRVNAGDEIFRSWEDGWFSIKIEGVIDIGTEIKKLTDSRNKILRIFEETEKKLSNDAFISNASPSVIERTKKLRDDLATELNNIEKNIKLLTGELK